MARDLGELNREEYARYKDDVKKEGKGFFPFAMWHDTVMSLVVVCVIAALAAIWYFDADGVEPGLLGPWYTEPADRRDDGLHSAARLVLLLPLLPAPDLRVAGDGLHRDRRHPDDLPHPPARPALLRPAAGEAPAHRPVAMVAAVLTILSMAVLTWKGATAKEALGSELLLLVPAWAQEQGFADDPQAVAGAELFAQIGLPELPHLSRARLGHPRRAGPLGDRADERRASTSSATSRTRPRSGTT